MLKNWYNSTTIHVLSVSIFHNNMPTRTKSFNKGLSQKVLFWTFGSYEKSIIRTIENSYKSSIYYWLARMFNSSDDAYLVGAKHQKYNFVTETLVGRFGNS